ncbi:MAG: ABC transporter ATP-binding protein [Clostridiales bacterium]|nr:ABC transporter ATP-binding protein [Clostridiales bacterium]
MINIQNVTKQFKTGRETFCALNDISLNIADAEFVAVTGRSGSGKSTLLNIIGTLDRATDGKVIIDGCDVTTLSPRKMAHFRNAQMGFIFQSFYLEPGYTVYDNVELPLIIGGSYSRAHNRPLVEEALKLVGLSDKAKNKANTLSGGEQQRVAIARAIINNPKYLFADEPCGNLDTANSRNVMELLHKLHCDGHTIIMVTHDEEDAKQADRIVTLLDGRIKSDEKRA